jgi:CelD/BcsL family acetyltransferase involved in cellulose biosynthesis
VKAGDETVGLLYCFLHDGWVYHYQSGFCYSLDRRRSPGLLTLYCVIDACLMREEIKGFDFMGGNTEYKRSLTRDSDYKSLRWLVIRRRTVSSFVYLLLRAMKNYAKAIWKSRQSVQCTHGSEPSKDEPISTDEVQ